MAASAMPLRVTEPWASDAPDINTPDINASRHPVAVVLFMAISCAQSRAAGILADALWQTAPRPM